MQTYLLLAATAHPVGRWSLFHFQFLCEDATSCSYSFLIDETPDSHDGSSGEWCIFTITAADGQPASNTSFAETACAGLSQYSINGGWDVHGFITVVVTDLNIDQYAFFSYDISLIADGQTVHMNEQPSYRVGVFKGRSADSSTITARHSQSRVGAIELWKVGSMVRGRVTRFGVDIGI